MYYLCKFSHSWAVYDEKSNSSRQLKNTEVESLMAIFPSLFQTDNKILAAIKIESIAPNKLLKLTFPETANGTTSNKG